MRALVLNLSNLGDVISGHVVHEALVRQGAQIDLVTLPQFTGLLHEVDGVRPLAYTPETITQLKACRYDLIVDLVSSGETRRLVRNLQATRKLGRYSDWRKWLKMRFVYNLLVPKVTADHVVKDYAPVIAKLGLTPVDRPRLKPLASAVRERLTASWWPQNEVIGLHFGASVPKRVLPAEQISAIIDHFTAQNKTVFLVGHEEPLAREIMNRHGAGVVYRRLTLLELRAVFERLTAFVGPDSGPLHLAAALDKPALGIYGPNLPARSGPLSSSVHFLESALHCRPCNQNRPCPIDIQCIRQISKNTLFAALDAL